MTGFGHGRGVHGMPVLTSAAKSVPTEQFNRQVGDGLRLVFFEKSSPSVARQVNPPQTSCLYEI